MRFGRLALLGLFMGVLLLVVGSAGAAPSDDSADLTIYKYTNYGTVGAGEDFTYFLEVYNQGPDGAGAVTVADDLPGEVTFKSATPSVGSCSESTGTVTCNLGDFTEFGYETIEIVVTAPDDSGTIVNTATVSSGTPDPNETDNDSTVETDVGVGADLSIYKYVSSPEGDSVSFVINVWNDGPRTAQGVAVQDVLPANADLAGGPLPAGCTANPDETVVDCVIGTMAPFDFVELEIVVEHLPSEGVVTNRATVRADDPADPYAYNNRDTATAVIGSPLLADLSIYKWGPKYGVAGSEYTYELWVDNYGPETAKAVRVTDQLPAGVTYVGSTTDNGECHPAGADVVCDLGDLAEGDFAFIEITVQLPGAGTLSNTAEVTSDIDGPFDPDEDGNSSTVETIVVPAGSADLQIFKYGDDVAGAGAPYTYGVWVWNNGPSVANGATVTEHLPAGVTDAVVTTDNGVCHPQIGSTVTCSLGPIDVYDVVSITVKVEPTGDEPAITNRVTVANPNGDPDPTNNEAQVTTDVYPPGSADLSVTKVASADPAAKGEKLEYAVRVENRGPLTAQNVMLTDALPANATFVSAKPSAGTCDPPAGDTLSCQLGSLAPHGVAVVQVLVTPNVTGTLTNTAQATHGPGPDPEPANNSTTNTTTVVENVVDDTGASSPTGTVVTDPDTGEVTVSMGRGHRSAVTVSTRATCPGGDSVGDVTLLYNGHSYPMLEGPPGTWSATIPEADIVASGDVAVEVQCSALIRNQVGKIELYDPSGIVTDKNTRHPVVGAMVRLYQVPGWRAQTGPNDTGPGTCESIFTKGPSWDQPAPTSQGVVADPDSGLISPSLNPQQTNAEGRYGWDVAAGCWYVVVSKAGYDTLTSPVVGVPPAVTDLDLELVPVATPPPAPPPPAPTPPPPAPTPPPPAPTPPPPAAPKPKPKAVKKYTVCHNAKTKKVTKKQLAALRKQVAKANKKKGVKKKQTIKMGACKKKPKKR